MTPRDTEVFPAKIFVREFDQYGSVLKDTVVYSGVRAFYSVERNRFYVYDREPNSMNVVKILSKDVSSVQMPNMQPLLLTFTDGTSWYCQTEGGCGCGSPLKSFSAQRASLDDPA